MVMSLWLLLLLSACAGLANGDTTQPLFRSPEAAETDPGDLVDQPPPPSASPDAASPAPSLQATEPPTAPVPSPSPTSTATAIVPPTEPSQPSSTATPAPSPTLEPSPTAPPTPTPWPSPTVTSTPLATAPPATPSPTTAPPPQSAVVSGRVVLQGTPPGPAVTLLLEDPTYQVLREVEVTTGDYRFEALPASADGYRVVFRQHRNPQFDFDDVVAWAWIGPTPVQAGDVIRLPDLEIGLLGLQQINPPPDVFLTSGAITPQEPIEFKWTPYPSASRYWVELLQGSALTLVWRSDFIADPAFAFEGRLADGQAVQPGSYWWRAGAQIEDRAVTLSGPLAGFTLRP